jgi:hypothetical protein
MTCLPHIAVGTLLTCTLIGAWHAVYFTSTLHTDCTPLTAWRTAATLSTTCRITHVGLLLALCFATHSPHSGIARVLASVMH